MSPDPREEDVRYEPAEQEIPPDPREEDVRYEPAEQEIPPVQPVDGLVGYLYVRTGDAKSLPKVSTGPYFAEEIFPIARITDGVIKGIRGAEFVSLLGDRTRFSILDKGNVIGHMNSLRTEERGYVCDRERVAVGSSTVPKQMLLHGVLNQRALTRAENRISVEDIYLRTVPHRRFIAVSGVANETTMLRAARPLDVELSKKEEDLMLRLARSELADDSEEVSLSQVNIVAYDLNLDGRVEYICNPPGK